MLRHAWRPTDGLADVAARDRQQQSCRICAWFEQFTLWFQFIPIDACFVAHSLPGAWSLPGKPPDPVPSDAPPTCHIEVI